MPNTRKKPVQPPATLHLMAMAESLKHQNLAVFTLLQACGVALDFPGNAAANIRMAQAMKDARAAFFPHDEPEEGE